MKIAAKQLHALSDSTGRPLPVRQGPQTTALMGGGASGGEVRLDEEDVAVLVHEMSTLAQLRHPNLVLFLGVTYDPITRTPICILTVPVL